MHAGPPSEGSRGPAPSPACWPTRVPPAPDPLQLIAVPFDLATVLVLV